MVKSVLFFMVSVVLSFLFCRSASADDLDFILKGVNEIGFPGSPGRMGVFGAEAFPVVVTEATDAAEEKTALVAAAGFGRGRLVAFGHNGFFSSTLTEADTGRLVTNLVRWAAGAEDSRDNQSVRVRVSDKHRKTAEYLRQQGFSVSSLQNLSRPDNADVLIAPTAKATSAEIAKLSTYVQNGGGLLTANLGWAWASYTAKRGQTLDDMPGNHLFAPAGIVWCSGGTRVPSDRRLKVSRPDPLFHADAALDAIMAAADGKRRLSQADVDRALFTLRLALEQMPDDDSLLRPELTKFAEKIARQLPIPTAKQPIRQQDAKVRTLLTLWTMVLKDVPVDQVSPSRAASVFPGSVPRSAKRVEQTVEIDTTIPAWHSTGLYAAPGEIVTVDVDSTGSTVGLSVRIGCHKDKLWHKEKWERVPEITVTRPVRSDTTRVANPFGGLVYVVVPNNCNAGALSVNIAGCVRAPYFVLGQTDVNDWRFTIRNYPAPWAELATEKFIITVPSKDIRNLDFPDQLMTWWDRVLDAMADLRTTPRRRTRPERMVMDEQIAAGLLHSGYPIMGQIAHGRAAVDLQTLRSKGHWGFFHELGHNHQRGDWTYNGMGEVTVNLFSLYCLDTINPGADVHSAIRPDQVVRKISSFRKDGKKGDAFLELIPYMQLQREFGWETFKTVFAEYEQLPKNERPRNDQEKRDQWLVRFSKHAGRNLGPFFSFWKIQTTQAARDSISDLPVWMPAELQ